MEYLGISPKKISKYRESFMLAEIHGPEKYVRVSGKIFKFLLVNENVPSKSQYLNWHSWVSPCNIG